METEEIQTLLTGAGFDLQDRGDYWSTSAIWRNGDNKNAIQIYKNTGVWIDYVQGNKHLPFQALINLVYGNELNKKITIKSKIEYDIFNFIERKVKIKMSKTWDSNILSSLLPHHKFYIDKGISEKILKLYRSGFATTGKLNARYVFPIFKQNNPNKIIGFTGRSFLHSKNNNIAKWKNIGSKKEWLYPTYIPHKGGYPFLNAIQDTGTVYLLESVGDSLAMAQNGYLNQLVTFGTNLSSEKLLFLSSLEPTKIVIVSNNDYEKSVNVGKNAAIRYFLQLSDFFNLEKISIKLPNLNDLSESHEKDKFKEWDQKEIDDIKQKKAILTQLEKDYKILNLPKSINVKRKIDDLKFYLYNDL